MADKNKTEPEMIPWDQVRHYINALLNGFIEDKGDGRLSRKYLDSNPSNKPYELDEKTARNALAQLLRSGLPLDQNLRDQLAALFDGTHETTKVKFERQTAGGQPDYVWKTAVAMRIYSRMQDGVPREEALQEAADHFGRSFETIKTIWEGDRKKGSLNTGYRKLLEKINRPLPR